MTLYISRLYIYIFSNLKVMKLYKFRNKILIINIFFLENNFLKIVFKLKETILEFFMLHIQIIFIL